jgi:hypothetical protein
MMRLLFILLKIKYVVSIHSLLSQTPMSSKPYDIVLMPDPVLSKNAVEMSEKLSSSHNFYSFQIDTPKVTILKAQIWCGHVA